MGGVKGTPCKNTGVSPRRLPVVPAQPWRRDQRDLPAAPGTWASRPCRPSGPTEPCDRAGPPGGKVWPLDGHGSSRLTSLLPLFLPAGSAGHMSPASPAQKPLPVRQSHPTGPGQLCQSGCLGHPGHSCAGLGAGLGGVCESVPPLLSERESVTAPWSA